MKKFILMTIVLATSFTARAQVKSLYTNLGDAKCRTVEVRDDEGGSYKGVCRGVGGYKLEVIEGDLRQTVNVIDARGKRHELGFWRLTGGFSAVGEQAEWRMKGKKPIALIVRLNVNEHPEEPERRTSYLVVAKITPTATCVTHFLKPTRSHNYEARKAADKSADRPCLNSSAQ